MHEVTIVEFLSSMRNIKHISINSFKGVSIKAYVTYTVLIPLHINITRV